MAYHKDRPLKTREMLHPSHLGTRAGMSFYRRIWRKWPSIVPESNLLNLASNEFYRIREAGRFHVLGHNDAEMMWRSRTRRKDKELRQTAPRMNGQIFV